MRDENYINIRKRDNDYIWNTYEKQLYYSYKNKDYIFPMIFGCAISFFINGGIVLLFGIPLIVLELCKKNNNYLDNNKEILKEREQYKKSYFSSHM